MLSPQITAGARTVAHLADHFHALKLTAAQMRSTFGVARRGYFTPTEDEQVRHLHVSYWQSRNALFELILSFRQQAGDPADMQQEAFLVAYGAVVLLVDAARYLRGQFGKHAAIVAKLNEPEPYFAIPAHTYDTVQQSLTHPVHAWQLYQAHRYYYQHRRALGALADQHALLGPVLAVIKQLGRHTRLNTAQYLRARLGVRARQIAGAVTQTALGRLVYIAHEMVGRMVADIYTHGDAHPQLPTHITDPLHQMLQPGDVLITRKEHALTNYFLPGYWPHAVLYLGQALALEQLGIKDHDNVRRRWSRIVDLDPSEPRRVLEAQKDGVWLRSLDACFGCTDVAVIRPRLSQGDIGAALARGLFHEGKPYDFDFDFTRSDRLVCTEVVYRAYEGVGGIEFQLTRRAGRMTLGAQDLLHMALLRRHFEPVAVYAATHHGRLATDALAEKILRATMADSE